MRFLHDIEMTDAMRMLASSGRRVKIAIAYRGSRAFDLLDLDPSRTQDLQVICCLKGRASDSDVIRRLGDWVRQNDKLHAKVIWTPKCAIAGSANASSNGLIVTEGGGLIEAGILVDDPTELSRIELWFDDQYRSAIPVGNLDLEAAWDTRESWEQGLAHVPHLTRNPVMTSTDIDSQLSPSTASPSCLYEQAQFYLYYVPSRRSGRTNLNIALQFGTWAFPENEQKITGGWFCLSEICPGDIIVFIHGFKGNCGVAGGRLSPEKYIGKFELIPDCS